MRLLTGINNNKMKLQLLKYIGALVVFILLLFNSCENESYYKETPLALYDSITDIDGNVYKTVKIGTQWWMAQNLRVKHYNNGDSIISANSIFGGFDNLLWNKKADSGVYYLGSIKRLKSVGLLYNYSAVTDSRKIAPKGWHVATDNDWKLMEMHLGMNKNSVDSVNFRGTNQGNQLRLQISKFDSIAIKWFDGYYEGKSIDLYKIYGTNESGFCAAPLIDYINFDGQLTNGSDKVAFWWTATPHEKEGWYRYLSCYMPNVFRFYGSAKYGFSVRCVKD